MKTKEFWISPGVEAWQSDEVVMNPDCKKPHHIHVVVKSEFDKVVALADKMASAMQFIKDMPMLKVTPTSGEDRTRARMATDMINQNLSDAKEAVAEFDEWKAHYSYSRHEENK